MEELPPAELFLLSGHPVLAVIREEIMSKLEKFMKSINTTSLFHNA